jgi:hypothetical protein
MTAQEYVAEEPLQFYLTAISFSSTKCTAGQIVEFF